MNKQKMLDFLGKQSVEDDEGWSEEVWRAGYAAAIADAIDMFKHLVKSEEQAVVPKPKTIRGREE